ncbi:hypothetical protein HPB49_025652 [Dermacentor silvarum]|uniref:Uncharacterized protein n=1 Tax=Dermacentor silvarum TaxID=543639 RepID=A0ACB8DLK8_DERSI|nr:hypothetical protein HPB49_025652 [Dermacentor silvarum]
MQCMGHTLQLAIKDAKEETAGVPAILKKCRAIVGHHKHSAQAAAKLQDCQRRRGSQFRNLFKTWKQDKTLKEAVCLELATSETTVANLTPQEWKAVAGLVKALEPIASPTKDPSGQKYATLLSMVLKDCIATDDDTSEFARNLLKGMRTRFPGKDELKEYVLAIAYDPRFKNLFCAQTSRKQGSWSLQELSCRALQEKHQVMTELRRCQTELRSISNRNGAQLNALLRRARESLAQQEFNRRLRVADHELLEAWRRLAQARQRKKTPSKKDRDMASKALRDRQALLKQRPSSVPR